MTENIQFDTRTIDGDGFVSAESEGSVLVYNIMLDNRLVYQATVDVTDPDLSIHVRATVAGEKRSYKTSGHALMSLTSVQNSADIADVTVIETVNPVSVVNYCLPRLAWHISNLFIPKPNFEFE